MVKSMGDHRQCSIQINASIERLSSNFWLYFQVNSAYAAGDMERAERASKAARRYSICSLVTGIILEIIGTVLYFQFILPSHQGASWTDMCWCYVKLKKTTCRIVYCSYSIFKKFICWLCSFNWFIFYNITPVKLHLQPNRKSTMELSRENSKQLVETIS